MIKFSVNFKDINNLKKKFSKQGQKELLQNISDEFEIASNEIRNKAIERVPVDQGFLRNSITVDGKDLKWIVFVGAEYGAYQEFGTKTKVDVPTEMQSIANEFRNKKVGFTKFKEAIAEWMRRKGIPQDAVYPIMSKILKIGIEPKPFLYPSFVDETSNNKIEKEIEKTIQAYFNK